MPRTTYPTNADFRSGKDDSSPENDGPDLCRRCFDQGCARDYIPGEIDDEWIDEDTEHPDYDGEDYRCWKCNALLTGEDN